MGSLVCLAVTSIENFLNSLFGPGGAFRILADRVDLEVVTVDADAMGSVEVWREGNILVSGTGVPHGNVPTIAYKIELGDVSIAFTSDQNGSDPAFIDFISGVDFLVIHLASSEDATGVIAQLHAKPSVWGQMATAADVGHVVVSHISTSSPQALEQSLSILRDNYSGALTVGEDLMCVDLN